MKFRYKEYCAGTFLLYRKLLSCKVKNAARGCAKAHSLFYERKKKRKQGKVSKNVMDYKLLAVFAGDILMQNGAETYRVEDTVYRILQKSNLKTVQVLVMMTGFVATLDDPTMDSLTVVRRIQSHGTNLEKIDQVNQISREFCNDELTLEQAFKQMKALWKEKEPPKKQSWQPLWAWSEPRCSFHVKKDICTCLWRISCALYLWQLPSVF